MLQELKHDAGSPSKLSNRMFIETILYQTRTPPWRDLPDEFGDWNAVYHLFRHWEKRELWKRFFNRLKQFRRITTRYDKLSRTFLAFAHLVSAWIMLQ